MFSDEVEHCRYYFDVADVTALKTVYDTYEREYAGALEGDALIAAYDYVLKCSHLFNVMDTRGAIGVTERATYFRRMREMTRAIAKEYVAGREALGYPLMKMRERWRGALTRVAGEMPAPATEAADVLVEIGVEEMPADDVTAALQQATAASKALFAKLRLRHDGLEIYATPRRIVIIARHVMPRQVDEEFIAKGPPADRAFDADGKPTRAALGFARGKGVDVADLLIQELVGGRYVTAVVRNPGRDAAEVLAQALPSFIGDLRFDKSMRWTDTAVAFSRPIRWIVALFGETVIPFAYAGVVSGNVTKGLRPQGSLEIGLTDAAAYKAACDAQAIVLDFEERKTRILHQAAKLAPDVGGVVPEDPSLLAEVANLVEAPTAFLGKFSERYLALPRDVLVTVMRKHQRYFAVEDNRGELLPYFIGVRNGDELHLDKVIHGNEQVIRARFADARFFYEADIKQPLRDHLARLGTLTFQAELGSMREKNDRVAATVEDLGQMLGFGVADIAIAREAAKLAKADLATSMVVEMTSLQGVMGREYALREGIGAAVAQAMYEHWLPDGADDDMPESAAGRLLALADKLDSVVGLIAVGLAPKSTSDPFGLRRSTLGIIRILVEADIHVDLRTLIKRVSENQPVPVNMNVMQAVFQFVKTRLESWLADNASATRDVTRAVLAEQGQNPAGAARGVAELAAWAEQENWVALLDSFARCVRITRDEEAQQLRPALFADATEKRLHETYVEVAAGMGNGANVGCFLSAFERMTPAVTAFFDNVLVHSDDLALRNNRIALLQQIAAMQQGKADLSVLENF
jgi:glycyl-tRNA synthetase